MRQSKIETALQALMEVMEGVAVEHRAGFGALTTYRVGGTCGVLVTCSTMAALERVLSTIAPSDVYVLGNGSNTLVADHGWDGIVLRLSGEFAGIEVSERSVRLGAAVHLPVAARTLAVKGLGGLEWAVGIPGTVGGAIKMNAGGHGSDTATWMESAEIFRYSKSGYYRQSASKDELELRYRGSNVGEMDIVASAVFCLNQRSPAELRSRISEIVAWRRDNQPGGQNAGSVFVNPDDDFAARLIDSIGMRGLKYRSAEVSKRHANFIQAAPGGVE